MHIVIIIKVHAYNIDGSADIVGYYCHDYKSAYCHQYKHACIQYLRELLILSDTIVIIMRVQIVMIISADCYHYKSACIQY